MNEILKKTLKFITKESYVLVKLSLDFPDLKPGSDLDIFCKDKEYLVKVILKNFLLEERNKFQFQIHNGENKKYIHIDFMSNKDLLLRLDLKDDFNAYDKLLIKKDYLKKILLKRVKKEIKLYDSKINYYVPSIIDEMVLRYIEYKQFKKNPKKIKHLEYIKSNMNKGNANKYKKRLKESIIMLFPFVLILKLKNIIKSKFYNIE